MVAVGTRPRWSTVKRHDELSCPAVDGRDDQIERESRRPAHRGYPRPFLELLLRVPGMNRQEAFDEYYKVAAFVQAYDGFFLNIKAWGVTVTAGAIAAGFSSGVAASRVSQVVVFAVALLLACAFWASETMFKMLQLAHV